MSWGLIAGTATVSVFLYLLADFLQWKRRQRTKFEIPKCFTWDQLQIGDIITVHHSGGGTMFQLVATDRRHNSAEMWNTVCLCGSPNCDRELVLVNMRKQLKTSSCDVQRNGNMLIRHTGKLGVWWTNEP